MDFTSKTIPASRFKSHCLAILDALGPEGLVVTKRGKPVAKVVPLRAPAARLLGRLKGKIQVRGDILSTGVTWNAES